MTRNGEPAAPPPGMELWLCSTNPAKLRQLAAALGASGPAGVLLRAVTDPAVLPEVIEDRADALGNARKKAAAFAAATGRPCLAMDASLLLPGLPAAEQPGVNVRRLPGTAHRPDDDEVLAYYTRLTERNGGRLRACWVFGLAIGMPDGQVLDATAVTERMLVAPPCAARQPGYPLNSLQLDPATGRYLAELTEPEAAVLQAESMGGPLRDLAGRAVRAALPRWQTGPGASPAARDGARPGTRRPSAG